MRGFGHNFSRLPHARALIAGAAILASVATAQAQPEETAFAVPRIAPPDGEGVGLPQPLSPSEVVRIRHIFALQAEGDFARAAHETAALTDPTLLGDILADRYLGGCYRATSAELTAWLDRYADLADAPAIRAQLLLRQVHAAPDASGANAAPPAGLSRMPWLDRGVQDRLRADHVSDALALIDKQHGLGATYATELRAQIAHAAFADGNYDRAFRIADHAFRQSGGRVANAGFVAGLAAWQSGQIDVAASLFERVSRAPLASPEFRAAGAFWAARALRRLDQANSSRFWLRRAGTQSGTFYGLLARRLLGLGSGLRDDTDPETLGTADVAAVDGTPRGHRAFALLQVGETVRAETALRQLSEEANNAADLMRSIMLVARAAGLTDLAADLATALQATDGRPRDNVRFPLPRLRPRGGFLMDPAIVYGLARLESNFDADAVSPAGARGLMQLMPLAAGTVTEAPVSPAAMAKRLADPALNLELGQRYLLSLARQDGVDGDLIRLLASYNAGPAATARWAGGIADGGDPLIFIESIPAPETREYVRRGLTFIWIYAARLRLPAPSLDELAAGLWPRFHDQPGPGLTPAAADPQVNVHAS